MKKPVLIGLCGRQRSGKDALADFLVEHHGYVKFNWSDPLLEAAIALDPKLKTVWWLPRQPLSRIIDKYGYVEAKKFPEVRQFLRFLGTEVVRECIHEDAWIEALKPRIKEALKCGKNVVVSGCRYENEAMCITKMNGYIVLVTRPGIEVDLSHSSEHGIADAHALFEVVNDGSLEELAMKADGLHAELESELEVPSRMTPESMKKRYEHHREMAIARGIRMVFECTCPDPDEAEDFVTRNRVEAITQHSDDFNKEIVIEVNGDEAGVVTCEDNVIHVACNIAR